MQEIKCPKCGEVFVVDESGYAKIVKQVRDREFAQEVQKRQEEFQKLKEKDLEIARMEQKTELAHMLSSKESELAEKDRLIEQLQAQLAEKEAAQKLALSEMVNQKNLEKQNALEAHQKELTDKIRTIEGLRAELANGQTERKLAVVEAVQQKESEITEKSAEIIKLQEQIANNDMANQLREQSLRREYEEKLKQRDEQIDYYKDFKARQSTKMVGESLEQHCLNQFNSLRMTAFPTAYFEKDNDAKTGSKGDFIFRESKEDTEFISIMFEMKNEMDKTATKHKNEDFFKELDKDRREKKCEYAVLVSLLEMDNELYNNGIVDVSYRYEKMYVIRPQFFIPMITLLRNAALNSLQYRQELEIAKNQQLDIANFEENMNAFKQGFGRNYEIASKKFKTAIDEIDKTITHLQKTKDALLSSENQLRLANNKAEDLSIKKLTKNAPSVRKMFEA